MSEAARRRWRRRKGFTPTRTHARLMKKWQVENNGVLAWLHDEEAA